MQIVISEFLRRFDCEDMHIYVYTILSYEFPEIRCM